MVNNMAENILIIEDKKDLCNRIADIIKSKGFTVFATNSISKSMILSTDNDMDLILIDSDINQGKGIALIETFREKKSTQNVPIILLSTPYKQIDYINEAINFDIDGLLFIPFEEIDLIVKVDTAIKIRNLRLDLGKYKDKIDVLENQISAVSKEHDKTTEDYENLKIKYENALNIDLETGVYNKKEFHSQFTRIVHESVRHSESVVLACFSIDHLDQLDKEFGSVVSKSIKEKFITILNSLVRHEDTIALIRENQFIIAFKKMREAALEEKIHDIKTIIEKQYIDYQDMVISFSVSVGVVLILYKHTYNFQNVEKEILPSEIALNNARRRGAGSIFMHPTIIRS